MVRRPNSQRYNNVLRSNIIWIEWVIFRNRCIDTCIHIYACNKLVKKEGLILRRVESYTWESLEGGNRKKKCNYLSQKIK